MRKLLLGAILCSIISCTNESKDLNESGTSGDYNTSLLLTKKVGPEGDSIIYKYDSNKKLLKRINYYPKSMGGNDVSTYVYTGDLITKKITIRYLDNLQQTVDTTTYTYEENKLSSTLSKSYYPKINGKYITTYIYTYLSGNKFLRSYYYKSTVGTQISENRSDSMYEFDDNGELLSRTLLDSGQNIYFKYIEYPYTKTTSNIVGYNTIDRDYKDYSEYQNGDIVTYYKETKFPRTIGRNAGVSNTGEPLKNITTFYYNK